jgi:pSer/pThr/pTyr-binding forkhead associated (FHA) protein
VSKRPPDRTVGIPPAAEPTSRDDSEGPRLIVVEGQRPGLSVRLERDETTIGRSDDSDLVLSSSVVSAVHARVARTAQGFAIEDAESTNGVLVNGKALARGERRALEHGDAITISDHLLLFVSRRSLADRTDMSTIHIDRAAVDREVEALLREFPSLRSGERRA